MVTMSRLNRDFQTITSNGKCDNEIVKIIEISRGAFNSILKKYVTVRHISMKKKLYKHIMCGRHFYKDVKHGQ